VTRTVSAGYAREISYEFWAARWLGDKLKEVTHNDNGCKIVISSLNTDQSDIHASVKLKHNARSLFYDLSLVVNWEGVSSIREGLGMRGIMRLYNVGQDTKFDPGGDKETSWMYELGFPREYYGASEPWAEAMKSEAAELFHLTGEVVQKWIKALKKKAEAEAH